jgi:threonine/homoserine/homoserine lactone efflux protein
MATIIAFGIWWGIGWLYGVGSVADQPLSTFTVSQLAGAVAYIGLLYWLVDFGRAIDTGRAEERSEKRRERSQQERERERVLEGLSRGGES